MARETKDVSLKAGQVAAVLQMGPKQLQNIVDAGYVRPSLETKGRGSVRLYSFGDLVRLRVFNILVENYGLERQRASRCVLRLPETKKAQGQRYLFELAPSALPKAQAITLPPIRLPLGQITKELQGLVNHVLETYSEGKRGRPADWAKKMKATLKVAAGYLEDVSDARIDAAVQASRKTRSARGKKH